MNLEEQRGLVATEIMKYKETRGSKEIPYHAYLKDGRFTTNVTSYHPDLEDNESLGQRERLKARLEVMECFYKTEYSPTDKQHKAVVRGMGSTLLYIAYSDLSGGAALLKAAAKLAKELAVRKDGGR